MKSKEYIDNLIHRYPVLKPCRDDIYCAYEILKESYEHDGKLLICGNGGSAADSEHIVGELMKGFIKPRKIDKSFITALNAVDPETGDNIGKRLQGALPAIALVDHVALSTAFGNDVDSDLVFAQQTYGYGQEGDTFLGITTSGNSSNVVNAMIVAKAKKMKTIALTGKDGGMIKDFADVSVIVPEEETYKIQELHLPIYHCLCLMLEDHFFGN